MQPLVTIPLEHGLLIASLMFAIGLAGVLMRRNIIFIFMSLEIMMNAAALAFVAVGAHWGQADGQVMFILILSVAAAEVAIALSLLLKIHRQFHTVDIDQLDKMRG